MKKKSGSGWLQRGQSIFFTLVSVVIILLLVEGNYMGAIIGLVLVLVWGLVLCWLNKDGIMMAVRQIEMILHGKPLDKEYWNKDEWKNRPKKKWVWGKKR